MDNYKYLKVFYNDILVGTLAKTPERVVASSQTMAREQLTPLTNDRHFIVMTPCTFELDRLIEEVNRLLAEPGAEAGADDQLPVFMRTF